MARHVRFEAISEVQGRPWASMAEFDVLDSAGAPLDRARWAASASSFEPDDPPSNAIDANPNSIWHSAWRNPAVQPPHTFDLDLGMSVAITGFRYLPRQDLSQNGNIGRYRFYISSDGIDWGKPIAEGDLNSDGGTVAAKSVLFAAPTPNRAPALDAPARYESVFGEPVDVKIETSDPDGDSISITAEGLPPGIDVSEDSKSLSGTPIVIGRYAVSITASDPRGLKQDATINWTVHPPDAVSDLPAEGNAGVRFVRLDALSEVGGHPWASVAEIDVLDAQGRTVSREGWKVSASSSARNDGPENALDGNPKTIWHTRWHGHEALPPHSLILDLRRFAKPFGIRVLSRQDGITNGTIAQYQVFVSRDGIAWGPPVAKGNLNANGRIDHSTISFDCLPWIPRPSSTCAASQDRR